MKAITLLTTLLITITSCKCKKETVEGKKDTISTVFPDKSVVTTGKEAVNLQAEVPIIYYEATTRGFFLATKVENGILYVSKDRDFKEYSDKIKISDADWKEISALAKAIDLDKVKDLKWPTEKRYYDGAPHANIIFESNGVKYPANGFDHGFPPAEVEKLVNKIMQLVENK